MTSKAVSRLLSVGARPDADAPAEYRSYVENGGARPQMGFAVMLATGEMHGFFYHNIDSLQLVTRNGTEFLLFTHRGKAITIQGTKLQVILKAITRQSCMEINETDGRLPAEAGMPTIQRIEVTSVVREGGSNPTAGLSKISKVA
jgi:hypothetical protein